jgi:hypothetical protein
VAVILEVGEGEAMILEAGVGVEVGVALEMVEPEVGVVDTMTPTLSCSGFMIEDDS